MSRKDDFEYIILTSIDEMSNEMINRSGFIIILFRELLSKQIVSKEAMKEWIMKNNQKILSFKLENEFKQLIFM